MEIVKLTGISKDKLLIGFGTALVFPLGYLFSKINKSNSMKHVINIILGIAIGFFLMGINGFIHTIISSLVVYLICYYTDDLKKAVNLVWIWSLLYMTVSHIIRMIHFNDGHMLDYCVIQMMLTCKLTAWASNLYYATLPECEIEKNKYWSKYKICKFSSLLEFFGYIFFFQTYLIGPFIEYNDYIDYINQKNKHPSPILPGLGRLFEAILILILMLIIERYFPYKYMLDPLFLHKSFWDRLFYCYMSCLAYRLSFEFIWTFVNAGLIFSGFAYNSMDVNGTPKWNKAYNMDLSFEISPTVQELPTKWNITVGEWLRHYCYERFGPHLKLQAMFLTNILSAFWHGIYPGYYIAFLTGSIILTIGRLWHKKIYPHIISYCSNNNIKNIYHIISIISTMLAVTLSFIPFVVLNINDTITIYNTLYFIPQISMVCIWIILILVPTIHN